MNKKITLLILSIFMILTIAVPRGECFLNIGAEITEKSDTTVSCIVQKGDTLYDIASYYQVPVREIMKVNELTDSLLLPGQVLIMPKGQPEEGSLSRGDVTREDLMLMAKLIHAEARGESFEGQVAVGAVILNRLDSPHFPQTIREIIYQKSSRVYQFSPVGDGSINLDPNEKAVQAAAQALRGEDPTGGALFFYNPDISRDQWIRTLPVNTRIGNHVFASVAI